MERCGHQFQNNAMRDGHTPRRTLSNRSQMPHAGQRGQDAIGGQSDHQSKQRCYMPNVKCYMPNAKGCIPNVIRRRRGHQSPKCMRPPPGQVKCKMRKAPTEANESHREGSPKRPSVLRNVTCQGERRREHQSSTQKRCTSCLNREGKTA